MKGICLGVPKKEDYPVFLRAVEEILPATGYDTLVLLARYQFQFCHRPGVATTNALTPTQAKEIAALCRRKKIRLIPKMNLLGHQSGKERGTEDGLLKAYPEFDETPDLDAVRYCRSLCPRHPEVKRVVCDLIDEMVEAFGADGFHIGCDEVFEIGHCPRCKGASNAVLFADWINTLHGHIVGKRGIEMLMWSDRLLDGQATGFGEWEASMNGTFPAVDMIPNDIICCDWHYGDRPEYPSVPYLTGKGFRTVVCPWREVKATQALLAFAEKVRSDKMLGVLQTSWCNSGNVCRALLGEAVSGDEYAPQVAASFKVVADSPAWRCG